MVDVKVDWDVLVANVRSRLSRLESFNLILIALPIETAHDDAQKLAEKLEIEYIDFDQKLIELLAEDGWEEHVSLAKHRHFDPGRGIAMKIIDQIAGLFQNQEAIVIGNPNFAAFYDLDLGALLYDRTKEGHCVLAAPGRISSGTLLLHGIHPQTGSGFMPAWELTRE